MKTKQLSLFSTLLALSLVLAAGGCAGDEGTTGANGHDGMDGLDGDNGTDGVDGTDGTDGIDGVDGTDGTNGTNGLDGLDGEDGDAGADGIDGEDGDMGLMGTMGVQGNAGASGIIDRTKLTGLYTVYPLDEQQTSGVTGDVRFAEFVDGATHATLITIRVSGTNIDGTIRLAHVHYNDVITGGSPVITLNKVDGFSADGTGMSETLVTHVDAAATNVPDPTETFVTGAAITYQDIVGTGTPGTGLNGYVNVHKVTGDNVSVTGTQVAAGDIGENF